jgi:hypothetical protein
MTGPLPELGKHIKRRRALGFGFGLKTQLLGGIESDIKIIPLIYLLCCVDGLQ